MAEQRSPEDQAVMDKTPGKAISVLEELRGDLESRMATKRVLTQLQRVGLLDRRGSQRILALPAHQRNEEILNEVQSGRGPDAPLKFLRALWPIHSTLSENIASKLWPFRTQVLWFVESPAHAAIVVDLLRESRDLGLEANFTFGGVQRTNCFFQRGLLCDEDSILRHDTSNDELEGLEVVVVFPATPLESPEALKSAFSDVKADVAVMSGVCRGKRWREEGGEDGIRCGDTIVVTQAFDERQGTSRGGSIGPKDEVVGGVRAKLQEALGASDQPKWVEQVKAVKRGEQSLRAQTLWLTRLFLELMKIPRAGGEGQGARRERGGGGERRESGGGGLEQKREEETRRGGGGGEEEHREGGRGGGLERRREGDEEETGRGGGRGERRESGGGQEGGRERDEEGAERELPWLARAEIGWDMNEPRLLNKHNQAVLTRLLPDWESGKLVSTLLHGRQLWTVDPASPLGMAPSQNLVTMVEQAMEVNPLFPPQPTPPPASSFPLPVFGAIATTPRQTENGRQADLPCSALATDFFSHQFYQIYSERRRLGPDGPCLVCKTVSYEMEGEERACVMASSCVVLEAVKKLTVEVSARKEAASPD